MVLDDAASAQSLELLNEDEEVESELVETGEGGASEDRANKEVIYAHLHSCSYF